MASEIASSESPKPVQTNSWSRDDRKKNKKLRHAGLEYVSRSGRTIAAKKQPDVICNCPQQCSEKVPKEVRERLFSDFYALADANSQNAFLQRYIEIRSVNKRLYNEERKESGRLQRRVTCKYRVPVKLPPRIVEISSINGLPAGNDVSIENTDAGIPSEDSDDDEDKADIDGEIDGDEFNENEKEEVNDLRFDQDFKKNEKNITVDSIKDNFCNGKQLENGESLQVEAENLDIKSKLKPKTTEIGENVQPEKQNAGTMEKLQSGKQNTEMTETGVKIQLKEETAETNVGEKENKIKSEVSVTSNTENMENTHGANTPTPEQKDIVEVCQKAFMNIFTITEKRVRLQREKIIDDLRHIAKKRKAEQEEMENTISVARELAAGCRPLLNFMDKSNPTNRITSLPNKLLMAIDNDITLVNNFFRNQLWKPENFNKRYKFDDVQSESEILD